MHIGGSSSSVVNLNVYIFLYLMFFNSLPFFVFAESIYGKTHTKYNLFCNGPAGAGGAGRVGGEPKIRRFFLGLV